MSECAYCNNQENGTSKNIELCKACKAGTYKPIIDKPNSGVWDFIGIIIMLGGLYALWILLYITGE